VARVLLLLLLLLFARWRVWPAPRAASPALGAAQLLYGYVAESLLTDAKDADDDADRGRLLTLLMLVQSQKTRSCCCCAL